MSKGKHGKGNGKDACTKHATPRLVFDGTQGAKVQVWAGASMDRTPVPAGCTVIDLSGGYAPTVRVVGFNIPGFTSRNVRIEWPDGSTPDLTAVQWKAIIAACVRVKAPIFVACMGGHGRTGTALAIIGHFLRAFPDAGCDPVASVRAAYCPKAVETTPQIAYIQTITGRLVSEKASGFGVGTYTSDWSGMGGGAVGAKMFCPLIAKGGSLCNLNNNHPDACDDRPRQTLVELGLVPNKKPVLLTTPLPVGTSPATTTVYLCPNANADKSFWCGLPQKHSGGCLFTTDEGGTYVLGETI